MKANQNRLAADVGLLCLLGIQLVGGRLLSLAGGC